MTDNIDGGGTLNREARRALNKHMKSTTSALINAGRESASESLIRKSRNILKTYDKPFEVSFGEKSIDIIPHAVYLICKENKLIKETEENFLTYTNMEGIACLKDIDVEISKEEIDSIIYLAEMSGNIDDYLRIYKLCKLSGVTAMETCVRASIKVSMYYLLEKATKAKKDNKKNNVLLAIKHETSYSSKSEPVETRFDILNMCMMLYWMHRLGLSDANVIKSEVGVDLTYNISAIIANNVPSSEEYEKWASNKITLEDAMIASGDIQRIEESRVQYYLGISKGLRAMIVESSLICKSTQKRLGELERYKENEISLYEKLQDSKKLRLEAQKEIKSLKKQLSESEKRASKLKSEIAIAEKKGRNAEDEKLKSEIEQMNLQIAQLKVDVSNLESELNDKNRHLEEIKEINAVNSRKMNMTINLYEDAQRYIEDLVGKGEIDYAIPIDTVISKILDKRIAICGGKEALESTMVQMGFKSIRHFTAGKIPTIKEFGLFDCLVIVTQQVAHKSIIGIRQFAKDTGKPIVYFNGSNIEHMCREVYEALQ